MPHLKSSCLRPFSCNKLIKCPQKKERKNSHSITNHDCCRTLFISGVCRSAQPSFTNMCFFKNELIILTFYCIGQTVKNNIWRNLTLSQYFRPVVKMDPKPRRTLQQNDFCCANFSFKRAAYCQFRRIK